MPSRIALNVADFAQRAACLLSESIGASTPMLSWPRSVDDGPTSRVGGSAFLVRTPGGILGITAGHVVDKFLADKHKEPDLAAKLGGCAIDLEERVISRGRRVDIATFRIHEAEISDIGFQPLEQAWPPEIPASDGLVLLAGWPGHERLIEQHVKGGLYVAWGLAGVSDSQITIRHDHQGACSPVPNVPLPEPGFEFGGISGGPVMLIGAHEDGRRYKWRVAGVIAEGMPKYDYIIANRADVIQGDGVIAG